MERGIFDAKGRVTWVAVELEPIPSLAPIEAMPEEDPRVVAAMAIEATQPIVRGCKACLPYLVEFAELGPDKREEWELKAHPNTHPLALKERSRNLDPVPPPYLAVYTKCLAYCAFGAWFKSRKRKDTIPPRKEFEAMWADVIRKQKDKERVRKKRVNHSKVQTPRNSGTELSTSP